MNEKLRRRRRDDDDDDDAVENPHTKNIWLRIVKFGTIALKFQRAYLSERWYLFGAHITYILNTAFSMGRESKA